MIKVTLRKNESFDSLLRRFTKTVANEGILKEVKERSVYLKPSIKKRKKRLEQKMQKNLVK